MKLRKPQLDCLTKFHEIYRGLPAKLSELNSSDIVDHFHSHHPGWNIDSGNLELTCALATGVGKTRLMGAFMAYLFKAQESQNFLLLAPRTTILDKLDRECRVSDPKYIFVDHFLIPQLRVITSDEFHTFDPRQQSFGSGPTIWISSPQSIARTDSSSLNFYKKSEYLGGSPFDYLRSLKDLVVIADESHHLGEDDDDGPTIWGQGLRDIKSRLMFAMTASPRTSANLLHEYSLPQCLADGLYTKGVHVIVRKRPVEITDAEWDKVVLRYAIERLNVKDVAVTNTAEQLGIAKPNPIILVCAKDKDHAQEVTKWLQTQVESDSVLMVHSGMQEKDYLGPLLKVENPDSKVRIVVNVFKLTEGWDVSNVYLIAPLRAWATVTGVLQTMGRGLRLPFKRRVEDWEVDTLDVLCFGRETMQEITDEVIQKGYGNKAEGESFISITDASKVPTTLEEKSFCLKTVRNVKIEVPRFQLDRPPIDLTGLTVPARLAQEARAFDITDPTTTFSLHGRVGFDAFEFVNTVATVILKKRRLIGGVTDAAKLKAAIEVYIQSAGFGLQDPIRIEPELTANQFVGVIDSLLSVALPVYSPCEGVDYILIEDTEISVPTNFTKPFSRAAVTHDNWQRLTHKGYPIVGWSRCAYQAATFDTSTELHVAKILDQSIEVDWWVRNIKQIFKLETPVGNYSPDFLFILKIGSKNVLLEVKGEFLAGSDTAESVVKAAAAEYWCLAVNSIGTEHWEHWFIKDQDAKHAESLNELEAIAAEWREVHKINIQ